MSFGQAHNATVGAHTVLGKAECTRLKRGSHLSDASAGVCKVSSRGEMSDRVRSDTLGGPFRVFHMVSMGSHIIRWTAASDKGIGTGRLAREGPHRRTAEETADLRPIEVTGPRMRDSIRNNRREEVFSSVLTDMRFERTSFGS